MTTVVEADLSRAPGVDVLVFVAEAAVRALSNHPTVSGLGRPGTATFARQAAVHLGITVDVDQGPGLVVVRDAGDLSVGGLARRIGDLTDRARVGALKSENLTGATFTVTNAGRLGALFDTPALDEPGAVVLGLGALVRRPVVVVDAAGQEQLAIRSMAHLALTYDRRVLDGTEAARYLSTLKELLQNPSRSTPIAVVQEAGT